MRKEEPAKPHMPTCFTMDTSNCRWK